MDYDVVVIGAGVVGLAIASECSAAGRSVLVIERHESFGMETSSRSSEVIHAGVYYPKGSLKAELCVEGNVMLYEIAAKRSIPFRNCSKLIVATKGEEERKLPAIMEHALEIGARDVRLVEKREIGNLEPKVCASAAVYFPSSGIIDSHSLMKYFHDSARERGADLLFKGEVEGIERKGSSYEISVREAGGTGASVTAAVVVNSAGLGSGKIAAMAGFDVDRLGYNISYRKGVYYRVHGKLAEMPAALIYPVPPEDATVGIHTVPELSGGMRLGPHDSWSRDLDYTVDPGLGDLFYEAASPYLPSLEKEDLSPDMAGFQAKRYGPGEPSRDFVIREESDNGFPGFINLIGIESPGLTSSPAIGRMVGEVVKERLR